MQNIKTTISKYNLSIFVFQFINNRRNFIKRSILFEKNYNAKILGGVYTITGQSVTLLNDKIDQYSRIGGNIEWQNNWITPTGFSIGALSKLNTNFYFSENKFYKNAMPTSMLKISYPIKKNNNFHPGLNTKIPIFSPTLFSFLSPIKKEGLINANFGKLSLFNSSSTNPLNLT